MALNLADRLAVMDAAGMQARVKAACINYALYLLGGTPTAEQEAWAKGCMDDPGSMGRRVAPHVLDDTNFLADGSGITDAQLKGAVETAINNRFIGA